MLKCDKPLSSINECMLSIASCLRPLRPCAKGDPAGAAAAVALAEMKVRPGVDSVGPKGGGAGSTYPGLHT